MGLFALLLRWLDWKSAALLAFAALLFNLFAMPRIGRGIYRDASRSRDPGIVAYPAMVLVLIVVFRGELAAAAALWAMMAFGDPAATIVGRALGGPRLPWNPKKTWAGLAAYALAGTAAAAFLWEWVFTAHGTGGFPVSVLLPVLAPVILLGAFLESLDTGIDDNWVPPIPCAALLGFALAGMLAPGHWSELVRPPWIAALGVNALVGVLAWALSAVSPSGAVGGAVVGSVILGLGGWPHYAVLWAFFALGTAATRLGYARKLEKKTAQTAGGQRGLRHVIANAAVPALLCALGFVALPGVPARQFLAVAYASAFAAALADTLGTELGSLYGRRPVSLLSLGFRAPGTPGAVSAAGVGGGILGGAAIAAVTAGVGLVPWSSAWIVAVAGLVGSLAESVFIDGAARAGRRLEHEFANAFNTFVGAVVALELYAWSMQGRMSVPFEWTSF